MNGDGDFLETNKLAHWGNCGRKIVEKQLLSLYVLQHGAHDAEDSDGDADARGEIREVEADFKRIIGRVPNVGGVAFCSGNGQRLGGHGGVARRVCCESKRGSGSEGLFG